MRRIELELEHRYKNKFVGKHRLVSGEGLKVLGSSRDAHIRLLGEDIDGIHALIDCTDGQKWSISDLGSQHGTWVQKQPIVEHVVEGVTVVNIGGHHLKIIPREINSDLFTADKENNQAPSKGAFIFHQVVVRKAGFVFESALLNEGETYTFTHAGETHQFKTPEKMDEWKKTSVGDYTVQQRKVRSERMDESNSDKLKNFLVPEHKAPFLIAFLMVFIFMGIFVFMPEAPKDEMKEVKPENQYTRIIFDAKKVKEKRAEAEKQKKHVVGQMKNIPEKKNATGFEQAQASARKSSSAKVVNNLKAAGLSALIGKISKRAAKNADFIQAAGKTPDNAGTGRALGLGGGSTLNPDGRGIASGEGEKIGGVGTSGKGGGSSAYKGVGGLSLGNVGNATVGVLEEETEVEGGLDRDVIARVIQSQLGQIRYCYERQLSASPELYGKVKVKFTIGAAGSVVAQAIGTTSLNNAMVEGCILRRIAGWQFPTPKGGTQVIVSYPFLFKSTQ